MNGPRRPAAASPPPSLATGLAFTVALALGPAAVGCRDCGPPATDASDASAAPDAADAAGAADAGPSSDAAPDSGVMTLCPVGPPPGATPTLSADVQPVFSGYCALPACHVAVGGNGAGLVLEDGATWASAVNVPAAQVLETSMLDRVEPGAPDLSYLMHKLQGTHLEPPVFGTGMRMPAGGLCLDPADLATIRAWIAAGAADD
jgi:hypothetical protein